MDPLDNTNVQPAENEPDTNSVEGQNNLDNQPIESINTQVQAARQEKPLTSPVQPQQASQANQAPIMQPSVQAPINQPANIPPASSSNQSMVQAPSDEKVDTSYVNRAEHIIEENKEDPYTEDVQEENLSQEFLNKKYGLNVDKSKE
jgi:hypothetical protein